MAGGLDASQLVRDTMPLLKRVRVKIKNGLEEPGVGMPYSGVADLPESVQQLAPEAQQAWLSAFNHAWESYAGAADQEGKAAATAWAAVKKGAREASDPIGRLMQQYELNLGARRLLVFPRGSYKHPQYGEMDFDDTFFDEIIGNFEQKVLGNTEPFIDIDHDHGAACGWLKSLSKEPAGLYATVTWTGLGESKLASGEYRYFSPWWGAYEDPESGKKYKRVLRGGALTNVPFLKVLPPIELYEPGVKSRARTQAWGEGLSFKLSELMAAESSVEDMAVAVRRAWDEQSGAGGEPSEGIAPMGGSQPFVEDVLDDAVVVTDPADGTHWRIPWTEDNGTITFAPDEAMAVQQEWVPAEEESAAEDATEGGEEPALCELLHARARAYLLADAVPCRTRGTARQVRVKRVPMGKDMSPQVQEAMRKNERVRGLIRSGRSLG